MIRLLREDKVLEQRPEHVRRIRFLALVDPSSGSPKSEALNALLKLRHEEREQYNRLLRSMQYAATSDHLQNTKHVAKDKKGRDIYEFRGSGGKGKHACNYRLYFFLTEEGDIVVCTHLHRKSPTQDKSFDRCEEYRIRLGEAWQKNQVTIDE